MQIPYDLPGHDAYHEPMTHDTSGVTGGGKETVLLLSGLLCDATIWRQQVAALEQSAEVRCLSFAGFSSIEAMAAHVLETAPPAFNLVGHSMGARVALEVIGQAPARVGRLALLDTGVHAVRDGEQAKREALLELARKDGMGALAARWLPPMLHPDHAIDGALMAVLTAMVERHTAEAFAGQIQALLGRPDATAQLGQIACPVLLGVGREDAWSPLAQHQMMAERISKATLVVFEHSGHMAPLEAPEAVTSALLEWLSVPSRQT